MIYLRLQGDGRRIARDAMVTWSVSEHKATKISKAFEPIGVDVKQFHSGDQKAA